MSNKMYIIKVKATDLSQILDGIRSRAEAYRRTEQYHTEGHCDGEIEEVVDEVEAADIAEHYEGVIEDLESQMKRQDFTDGIVAGQHLTNAGGK